MLGGLGEGNGGYGFDVGERQPLEKRRMGKIRLRTEIDSHYALRIRKPHDGAFVSGLLRSSFDARRPSTSSVAT